MNFPKDIDDAIALNARHEVEFDLARAYAPDSGSSEVTLRDDFNIVSSQIQRDEFASLFFEAAELTVKNLDQTALYPSASVSYFSVLSLLRREYEVVYLPNPTFRKWANISDALNYRLVPYTDLRELRALNSSKDKSIAVLVCPSVPFGHVITEAELREVLSISSKHSLVFDFCGRFHSSEVSYDQYRIIRDANRPAWCIEDTGKTFPAFGCKLSLLTAFGEEKLKPQGLSANLVRNPSARHLSWLKNSIQLHQMGKGIDDNINSNRKYVESRIKSDFLVYSNESSSQIINLSKGVSGLQLAEDALEASVRVLPASFFYWTGVPVTEFFRVSLTNEKKYFEEAFEKLILLDLLKPIVR